MMDGFEVKNFPSSDELYQFAGEEFVRIAWKAIKTRGRFIVALSGGSTPRKLYELLATDEFSKRIDWGNVHIFWGDERCVMPNSPQSNYRMVDEALLSKVPIAKSNVHRFLTELGNPPRIAKRMEIEIKEGFAIGMQPSTSGTKLDEFPRFDLILLGMGKDGHTASLFPNTAALKEHKRIVIENYVPQSDSYRLTFTYPTINNAREILFLVAGVDKAAVLSEVLHGEYRPEKLPSQGVKPIDGKLIFLTSP